MRITPKMIQVVASGSLAIALVCTTTAAASTAADIQEKIIASKRSGNLVVTMTNEAGKFTPDENHFCVLFKAARPSAAIDLHEVSVGFRLLVGRIEEAPITASLKQNGANRYCGLVNLGPQYYRPASYYAFVHYVEVTGRKRSIRLFLAVR